ncbi:NAD(P)/FAD-dependent oxidoreductase [Aquabacterium sp. A7-Y]|uniref:NAD(P)/FAD-dependent oxidoreductase n=1 Tax=Aquabacterium sp. A7-Y TaxID=1349605 RepID=UPI00223D6C4D|nr:NAD(P)/FAD-dependent oxidoreductase [Aquabacterium sp. A7-Y]MCW7537645.1 NAD(P)/FAD-dependent oxidoreductase [Aquabacterium sp. A7-Y]
MNTSDVNSYATSHAPPRPRVVIVGCGFGGLEATRTLARTDVEITLIDRTNHHLFQPLLYQVATAGLAAPAISAPIRHILRKQMQQGRLTVLLGEVVAIEAAARAVVLNDGVRIPYDHLIVATGATHSYFGRDEWARYAPGLKTLADAFDLRNRVLKAFEKAERYPEDRQDWMSFAVIGGGPTGVEMAGTMAEIAHHTLYDEFRRIDSRQARVLLIEGADRILGSYPPELSERARHQLEKLKVEVCTGCRVIGIDAEGVTVQPAEGEPYQLRARTVVWAAGVAGSPLGKSLQAATGATLDRAGRVLVEPDLSLPGHPEIHVIGDLATAKSYPKQGEPTPVPGVSPSAKQMGRHAAANIQRRLRGEATRPFHYIDYGSLATIGRKAAVAQVDLPLLGTVRFSGYPAWLFWLFVHIYFLIGFRNRLMVLTDWAWAYWTFQRNARVVVEPAQAAATVPPAPLETPR